MELAISMLVWAIGAAFGALCISSTERGEHESAWRYRLYMAYFFCLGFVLMLFSSVLGLGGREVALLGLLAVVSLVVSAAVAFSRRAEKRGP